jgi:hypothetical protein
MKRILIHAGLGALVVLNLLAGRASAQSAPANLTKALQSALAKNAAHAREWLDQKDFKSLAQSAGSLQLLADLLKSRSDDAAWQAATAQIAAAVGDVQSAARGEDAAKCVAALDALDKSIALVQASSPGGKPLPAPRGPATRSLMLAMGGILGDAKIDLIKGDVAEAKSQALVLSEVGKLVSNSRSGEPWTTRAGAFTDAALAAANAPETDPQKVRQLLRGISQRCDACHEMRGAGR